MTAKLLTTQLGAEDYGRFALAATAQLLFAQVIFTPLGSGVARYLMPLTRAGRVGELHMILNTTLARLLTGFALLAALSGVISAIGFDPALGLLIGGGIIYGAAQGAASIFQTIETAARRRRPAALVQSLPSAARLLAAVLVIVLIHAKSDVVLTGMALATAGVLVPQMLRLRSRAQFASAAGTVPSSAISGGMWQLARRFSIWGLFYAAQLGSDVWALKLVLGDRLVGAYAVALLTSSTLILLASFISQLVHPVVYERASLGPQSAKTPDAPPVLHLGVTAMLIITLLATVGSIFFGNSIVLLLSDPEYLRAADVLPMVMLGVGLRETGHIAAVTFFARGDTQRFLVLRTCVSVLTILANVAGAVSYGLTGVAMASVASGALYLGAVAWLERPGTRQARH